jgi:hypothetical protein
MPVRALFTGWPNVLSGRWAQSMQSKRLPGVTPCISKPLRRPNSLRCLAIKTASDSGDPHRVVWVLVNVAGSVDRWLQARGRVRKKVARRPRPCRNFKA